MGGSLYSIGLRCGRAFPAWAIVLVSMLSAGISKAQTVPVAEFVADKAEISLSEYLTLTDISSNNPTYWNWSISPSTVNGKPAFTAVGSSTPQKQVLLFHAPGMYTVTLIAGNSAGSDTLTKTDYVVVLPSVKMCSQGTGVTDTVKEVKGYLYDDGGVAGGYGKNKNCIVVIKPPCADSISLTFRSFDVSAYAHSGVPAGDHLRVYDGKGPSSKSLHDSAGYAHGFQNQFPMNAPVMPPTVKAVSGAMYIEWHTDASTEADGFEARWETYLRTFPKPPVAKFTGPETVFEKLPVTFSSQSTGPELRYLWDLDLNGSFDAADVSVVSTTYPAGLHFVMMVAINCGGTDTFIRQINVKSPKTVPKVDFTADVRRVSSGDVIQFTDLSKEGPWEWTWSVFPNSGYKYVNGTSNNSQHPQIQFLDPGKYTVQLIAENAKGNATLTKTGYITVYSHCEPSVTNHNPDIGISRVEVIDIANKSIIDQASAAGVADYTLFSLIGSTKLEVGGKYIIRVSRPSSANRLIGKIWIDLNADGDFTDSLEEIYSNNEIKTRTWGHTFVMPSSIDSGGSRMRIGVDYFSMGLDPCGSNPYGEFEDYSVNLMPDRRGPDITILGDNPFIMEEFQTYTDSGATAFDNVYGNLTNQLITTVKVDSSVIGIDTVTYEVTDSVGNKSTAYRFVNIIRDTTNPVVSIIGSDTVYHEVNTFFDDWGVAVNDNVTLRTEIKVEIVSTVDTAKLGVYKITYTAKDKRGNTASRTRTVIVQDKTPPDIILLGGDFYKHQVYTPFTDPGVKVKDNYWPDSSFTSSGTVNVNKRGTYIITYTATDQSGNTAVVKRTVKVDDYIPPKIKVIQDTVTLEVFKPFVDPPSIWVGDNFFSRAELTIHRTGKVMDHYTGFYPVGYFASDPSGNLSDTDWVIVHVVDLTPPVVYMLGNIHDTVRRWHRYIDEGYIVGDNYDSVINVVVGGTFKNTFTPGIFTRTYTGYDKSGNKSGTAMRWITVLESLGLPEDESQIGRMDVYPNPALNLVNLRVDLLEKEQSCIYITNALGQRVMNVFDGRLQHHEMTIDMNGFAGGLYFIHCQSGGHRITRKLVISR